MIIRYLLFWFIINASSSSRILSGSRSWFHSGMSLEINAFAIESGGASLVKALLLYPQSSGMERETINAPFFLLVRMLYLMGFTKEESICTIKMASIQFQEPGHKRQAMGG